MCLLCLSGNKDVSHFQQFMLPRPAAVPGSGGTLLGAAAAPTGGNIIPNGGGSALPAPASASVARSTVGGVASLSAFSSAAVMGLAQAERSPSEQRALVTTMSTLGSLVSSANTAAPK